MTLSLVQHVQCRRQQRGTLVDHPGSVRLTGGTEATLPGGSGASVSVWNIRVPPPVLYRPAGPPLCVVTRRFHGDSIDHDSPIRRLIKLRVPGSGTPGTCRVQEPPLPPPSPRCRSRVFRSPPPSRPGAPGCRQQRSCFSSFSFSSLAPC